MIKPKDIYTFYTVEYYYNCTHIEKNNRAIKYYLGGLRMKYLDCFRTVLEHQINRYIRKSRIDAPIEPVSDKDGFEDLHFKMTHTLRGNRERKNERWIYITEHLNKLDKVDEYDIKKLIYLIDRINNAVHNEDESVLYKIDSYLMEAFYCVSTYGIEKFKDKRDERVINNLFYFDKKREYMLKRWGV